MAHSYLIDAGQRPGALGVSATQLQDAMEFELSGELDLSNAPALKDVLERAVDNRERVNAAPMTRLILDLRQLRFIDSRGIEALISTKRLCLRSNVQLHVKVDEDSQVRRVLHLAGMAEFLGVD